MESGNTNGGCFIPTMASLTEFCDVLAANAYLSRDRIGWIWSNCIIRPNFQSTNDPAKFSLLRFQGVLAAARLLSQCPDLQNGRDLLLILVEFVQSLPTLPAGLPFPKFSSTDTFGCYVSYFKELTKYLAEIVESDWSGSRGINVAIASIILKVVNGSAIDETCSSVIRAFLFALARNCPRFDTSDASRVCSCLLEKWILPAQASSLASSASDSCAPGSPFVAKHLEASLTNGTRSPSQEFVDSPSYYKLDWQNVTPERFGNRSLKDGIPFPTSSEAFSTAPATSPPNVKEERRDDIVLEGRGLFLSVKANGNLGLKHKVDRLAMASDLNEGTLQMKQHLLSKRDRTFEFLEKQDMAFRFLAGILEKTESNLEVSLLHQMKNAASWQLKALPSLIRLRKRDWCVDGVLLKTKIEMQLRVLQAAVLVYTKCFLKFETDGKAFRSLLREILASLLDAADACVASPWHKMKASEELYCSLLCSVAQVAALHGSHIMRSLLFRLKPLILTTCAQVDTWANSQGLMFESIVKASCKIINAGWNLDARAVESFILALAANIREHLEQDENDRHVAVPTHLNVIRLLADLAMLLNKVEVVEMILPLFVESLEEGDASTPCLLRLRLLDAVAHMASLGFEKSYRESVVLLTRSYLDKLSSVGSNQSRTLAPEATTERLETLPGAFLTIACGLKQVNLRSDFRQRLLLLCSDVGVAAESASAKSGADLLGPLLPSVAEICSDFDPLQDVEPSLLKLFRNLWFYIVLFGLAPPIHNVQASFKSSSSNLSNLGSMSAMAIQAVNGPYMWNTQWLTAVQQITAGTPPLVVSSVKWLEDELELNALHNPASRRGLSNEKSEIVQRAALSAALGVRVENALMSTISGVKATYLLAVAFLEITRLSCNGGILRRKSVDGKRCSALCCVFEYLETPNLISTMYQCLTTIIQKSFDTAMTFLEERMSAGGLKAEEREAALVSHACFLTSNMTHQEENIRELSVNLLDQIKTKHPQILWNTFCLDTLLHLVGNYSIPAMVADASGAAALRLLLQRQVQEWVTQSLLLAPCTTHGLLQEQFRKLNTWPLASHTTDLLAFLSEIRLDPRKNEECNINQIPSVPAVISAAAAAAGASPQNIEVGNLQVLSTGIVCANIKSTYIYVSIGGLTLGQGPLVNSAAQTGFFDNMSIDGGEESRSGSSLSSEKSSLNEMLIARFLQLLQQFVTMAERGALINARAYHEACLRATALLLSDMNICERDSLKGFSQLLRLICWCPAYIFSPEAMETGIFVWTWIVSAVPHLGTLVLAELVEAWLWTADTGRGLFASGVANSGPAAKLMPLLMPGEPVLTSHQDPVEGIATHRLWLGFFLDRFEVVRHSGTEQLLLIGRLLQGSLRTSQKFSSHPAAAGAFFTLMLLGLKFCACQLQSASCVMSIGVYLLEDRIYRAALGWFAVGPGWYESCTEGLAQAEAQAVSIFVQHLTLEHPEDSYPGDSIAKSRVEEIEDFLGNSLDNAHPVWGRMGNYFSRREKGRQLLLMLCQHEADRLDAWANPLKDAGSSRFRVSSERWVEYVRTAWSVDPCIALSLVSRFPLVATLRSEVSSMVQGHLSEVYDIAEAVPFFVTPRAVEENAPSLQCLPHCAPCSITRALEFLTPPYKGHHRVMAYVLRVLESYPPERVTFIMPQLVQALRYDDEGLVEQYLMTVANRSNLFAHILIWQLQGEEPPASDDTGKEPNKVNLFHEIVLKVKKRIIDSFTPDAYDMFMREFHFFDKITSISGILFPLPKEERRAGIQRELKKIELQGDDLYLPTAPNKLVRGIQLDSGIPLQSAAKVPIMITFNVVERGGDPSDIKPQACIFKVGDDCRQDVLALQVIAMLRDIFEAVCLNLYLFPYGVLPTGCGRGIIEVVPNTRSRNQMGETTDGGLYEIFQQEYGPVGSPQFEAARDNFIVSCAGYAVASLLLQPKDRHNGNLLFDNEGRLVHIDFGFILETSPGGNLRFENAQFKLSHEMTQLLDPSGVMKSDTWSRFVSLCVKGYLGARQHMDGIVNTVLLMVDSGLPCFSRGDPIGNLRKRFHPEMTEREAANFMIRSCTDAYNKWTTAGYDLIQYLQQGIEK